MTGSNLARLSVEQWELLEADYHTGRYSKNQLAEKYNLTHTAVNKRLKDIAPKFQELVSTQIAIKSELSSQSFKQVSAIETAVEEALKNKDLIYTAQQKALRKATDMIDEIDSASDLKCIIDGIDRASLTLKVNERHAPKTDIALTNAQQNNEQTIIQIVRDVQ